MIATVNVNKPLFMLVVLVTIEFHRIGHSDLFERYTEIMHCIIGPKICGKPKH